MTGAAAGDDGDGLSWAARVRPHVNYLVLGVACYRGIGDGDGVQGRVDQVGWVVDKVSSRHCWCEELEGRGRSGWLLFCIVLCLP